MTETGTYFSFCEEATSAKSGFICELAVLSSAGWGHDRNSAPGYAQPKPRSYFPDCAGI